MSWCHCVPRVGFIPARTGKIVVHFHRLGVVQYIQADDRLTELLERHHGEPDAVVADHSPERATELGPDYFPHSVLFPHKGAYTTLPVPLTPSSGSRGSSPLDAAGEQSNLMDGEVVQGRDRVHHRLVGSEKAGVVEDRFGVPTDELCADVGQSFLGVRQALLKASTDGLDGYDAVYVLDRDGH